jgi:plastocyanin
MQLIASLATALIFAAFAASSDPSSIPSPGASPQPIVVHIHDMAFSPLSVKIKAGQSVTFVNDDEMVHTVTAEDKSFDSADLQQGKRWAHAFTKVGTSKYTCTYHPFMKGSIVVEASST